MRRGHGIARPTMQTRAFILTVAATLLWAEYLSHASAESPEKDQTPPDEFAGQKAGDEWDRNGLKMKFCWCPPGKFTMGSPKDEPRHHDSENQVEVTFTDGFWLGKHEVTQAEWKGVLDSQPWKGEEFIRDAGNYPVANITWLDADDFCDELTRRERDADRLPVGWEYRLPTEAQWEYACRAGSKTRFHFGDDESRLGDFAWSYENAEFVGDKYAHRVGGKKPNAWGLYDMHGNVWEWCRDWYSEKLPGGIDPEMEKRQSSRVLRGGSWQMPWWRCRSATRHMDAPTYRFYNFGFRVALVKTSKLP